MLKRNIFDEYWNDIFDSFIGDIKIYLSLTIHTLDPNTNQFNVFSYSNITINIEKTCNIDGNIGLSAC